MRVGGLRHVSGDKCTERVPHMTILVLVSGLKKHRLSNMSLDFVSLVPAGDNPEAFVVISKADPNINMQEDDMGDLISKDDLAPEVVEYVEGLESENDTLTKAVEDKDAEIEVLMADLQKAEDSGLIVKSEEEQFTALLEKANPAVRVLLQKQAADLKVQTDIAKAERDTRISKEFISKAEGMPMLAENKDEFGSLLRKVAEALDPEDFVKFDHILKTANEQIAKGNLFAEFGSGGGETTISKSVEAAASEIQKVEPTLTREQAIAKAYETNPALLAADMTQEG